MNDEPKPKWLETEFWLQVAAVLATVISAVVGVLPASWSPVLLAVQAALYTWYRQQSKSRTAFTTLEQTEDLALSGFHTPPGKNGTGR